MLILDAEILTAGCAPASVRRVDVRLAGGRIVALAPAGQDPALRADGSQAWVAAQGRLLLPGLHDHHLHLASLAVALASVPCGPPQVHTAAELVAQLQAAAADCAAGCWLRGYGYHATVAGEIERHWLDRILPRHPVRIQQRSGRLWLLNTLALQALLADLPASQWPAGLECHAGQPSGRLYDADDWLAVRLAQVQGQPRRFPDLTPVSAALAAQGITGVCDTTPGNDVALLEQFVAAKTSGALRQELLLMGNATLDPVAGQRLAAGLRVGPLKLHLHENDLPDFDQLVAGMARSHAHGRAVAVHCVTVTELVFALNALAAAGAHPGDRIEHAALVPPELVELLAASGATVVSQPNFIFERGEVYRREVAAAEQAWLYRLAGLRAAGVPLAGSSDAPFGQLLPWQAMQAAVSRRSAQGTLFAAAEALSPEAALALFLGELAAPGGAPRRVAVGAPAELCLIDRSWQAARRDLAAVRVCATWQRGQLLTGAQFAPVAMS